MEISDKTNLTYDEAVDEYIELKKHEDEDKYTSGFMHRIRSRLNYLADIIIKHAIEERNNGRVIRQSENGKNACG